jgi:hypothetical protein
MTATGKGLRVAQGKVLGSRGRHPRTETGRIVEQVRRFQPFHLCPIRRTECTETTEQTGKGGYSLGRCPARDTTLAPRQSRSERLLGRGAGSGARRPTPGGADPSFPAGSARFQHSVEPSSEGPRRAWRILEAPGRAGLPSTRGQSREQGRDPHCRRGLRRRGRGWSARSCTLSGSRHRLPRRMRVQQQCAVGRRRAPPMTDVLQAGADARRVGPHRGTFARAKPCGAAADKGATVAAPSAPHSIDALEDAPGC